MLHRIKTLLAVGLLALAGLVHADDYASLGQWTSSNGSKGSSADSACTGQMAACSGKTFSKIVLMNPTNAQCFGKDSNNVEGPCGYASATYSCPFGGTMDTSTNPPTCKNAPPCTAPNVRDSTGECKPPPDPCAAKGQLPSVSGWVTVPVGSGIQSNSCLDNCQVVTALDGNTPYYYTDGKTMTRKVTKRYSGSSCTASDSASNVPLTDQSKAPSEPPKKPPCADGEGVMTSSSGTIACVPAGSPGSNPPVKTTEKTTTTNAGGGTTTKETTTTRDPATGVEEKSTTTTTRDAGGSVTGVSSESSSKGTSVAGDPTKPQDSDFCSKNPNLQICKGGLNEETTQKEVRDNIKQVSDRIGEVENVDDVKNAQATQSVKDQGEQAHNDAVGKITDGTFNAGAANQQSAFDNALSTWFDPVTRSGCSPLTASIGGRTWNFDMCDTADKISEIAGYALWVFLAFGSLALVTKKAE